MPTQTFTGRIVRQESHFGFLGGYRPIGYLAERLAGRPDKWCASVQVREWDEDFIVTEDEPCDITLIDVSCIPLHTVLASISELPRFEPSVRHVSVAEMLQLQARMHIVKDSGVRLLAGEFFVRDELLVVGFCVEANAHDMSLSSQHWHTCSFDDGMVNQIKGESMIDVGLHIQSLIALAGDVTEEMVHSISYTWQDVIGDDE